MIMFVIILVANGLKLHVKKLSLETLCICRDVTENKIEICNEIQNSP